MLEFLSSLKEVSIAEVSNYDVGNTSAENCKAALGMIKMKINLLSMIIKLPGAIKQEEDELANKDRKLAVMKASQEGGTI